MSPTMETDIIIVSDAIEIHPADCGDWSVVRHGNVYGTYEDLSYAREIADELADNENKVGSAKSIAQYLD